MQVDIQTLQPKQLQEFRELLGVFAAAFEMNDFVTPSDAHLEQLLLRENFLVIAATADGKIAGGLTIHVLGQYYSESSQAYIYDFAVHPSFQRSGIGKQLMQFTLDYCTRQGYEAVFVQADQEDQHAIEFYRAVGATREADVVHFTYEV